MATFKRPDDRRSLAPELARRARPARGSALLLTDRSDYDLPWRRYYDKGSALSRLDKTDDALGAFSAAEERYALSDQWGRSVAIYGRARALGEAKRCDKARREFAR